MDRLFDFLSKGTVAREAPPPPTHSSRTARASRDPEVAKLLSTRFDNATGIGFDTWRNFDTICHTVDHSPSCQQGTRTNRPCVRISREQQAPIALDYESASAWEMQLGDPERFAELSGIRERDLSEGEATLTLKKPPDDYASVATCPLCCDTLDTWVSVASVEWPDQPQNLKELLVHVECTPRMPSALRSEPPLTPITGTGVANSTRADDSLSASSGVEVTQKGPPTTLRRRKGSEPPSRASNSNSPDDRRDR